MKNIFFIIMPLAALSPIAIKAQKQNYKLEEAKKAIAESNAIYFTSFAKNDSSIFIDRYADDACLMPAGAPKTCGKYALAKFFREKYNKGYRGGEFVTIAVYGDGEEYVTEEAIGRIFDASGRLMSEGKILVLWKKTPTGWKMYRDSFSGDLPEKPKASTKLK